MGASRQQRRKLFEKLVGETVADRFEITSLLGFGGMGAVYRAVQQNMQRDVALKVIPSHDPTTEARFEREALTISQLRHPNTVTVFDYGQTDHGLLFLAMEMLSGETLTQRIVREGPLAPERAVHIASQVCRSLGEAHRQDIVHRDIKPDNIFLIRVDDDPDFVKVLDFGIAKIVRGDDNVDLTGTGRIIGTPKYMSPEQILSEPIDHRSDLYSLGCILFEMMSGSPPFKAQSTTKLMLAHAHKPPPNLSERLSADALARIGAPLEGVVRRALSKSPSGRHADVDEFRRELEEAVEQSEHGADSSQSTVTYERNDTSGDSEHVTDSSDLLDQYSSQTLAELDRPETGTGASPSGEQVAAAEESEARQPAAAKKVRMEPVHYAIVLMALLIAGLMGYAFYFDEGESEDDNPEMAFEEEVALEELEEEEPAEVPDEEADEETAAADSDDEPDEVEVRVVSEPEGAQIYEEGRYLGKTPMIIDAGDGDVLEYEFEREGYEDLEATFEVESDREEPQFEVSLEAKEEEERTAGSSGTDRPSRPTGSASSGSSGDSTGGASSSDESSASGDDEPDDQSDDDGPRVDKLDDDVPDLVGGSDDGEEDDDGPAVPKLDD